LRASLIYLPNLSEVEKKLEEIEDELFCLIGEGWEEGFIFEEGCSKEKVIQLLREMSKKYGDSFVVRAFNEVKEVCWHYDEGFYAEIKEEGGEYEVKEEEYFVETDNNRFPGVKRLGSFEKVRLQRIVDKGKTIYLKMEAFVNEKDR